MHLNFHSSLIFFLIIEGSLLYNIVLVLPYINMNLPRVYTCSPSWTPLPPISSLWVIPVHQPQASCIMHRTWTGDSFHIWYYICFNAILTNHPILSFSHRIQRLLYTSVSLLLSRRILTLDYLNLWWVSRLLCPIIFLWCWRKCMNFGVSWLESLILGLILTYPDPTFSRAKQCSQPLGRCED